MPESVSKQHMFIRYLYDVVTARFICPNLFVNSTCLFDSLMMIIPITFPGPPQFPFEISLTSWPQTTTFLNNPSKHYIRLVKKKKRYCHKNTIPTNFKSVKSVKITLECTAPMSGALSSWIAATAEDSVEGGAVDSVGNT